MLAVWTRLPKRIDADWFAREQADLVAFAQDPWARRYLQVDWDAPEFAHLPIVGLYGNGVHYQRSPRERVAVFYTRDHFAQRLHGFACMVRSGDELMARTKLATPSMEALAWAVATTATFNPDANPEVTSVDGRTVRNVAAGEAWATIRAGAGTTADDATANDECALARAHASGANTWIDLARGLFLFDSSSLGGGALISAATLSPYGTAITNFSDTQSVAVVSSSPASNTALVAADFSQVGSTRFASDISIATWNVAGYNDFALNASGIANISKIGVSKFATRLSGDVDNAAPTWGAGQADRAYVNWADNGSNKPKLVVTYTLSAPLLFADF